MTQGHNRHDVRLGRLACIFALGALLASVLAFGTSCANDSSRNANSSSSEPIYQTYLDDNALGLDGNRVTYVKNGVAAKTGIDVSESQGYIDWDAVASDGISFVFVRLGNRGSSEGGLYMDDYVSYNIKAAQEAGLEVHGYFYSQAISAAEAAEEADYAISLAKEYGLTSGYIAYDLETETGRTYGLTTSTMDLCANAFCQRVVAAGYKTLVYGNRVELGTYSSTLCSTWPIWLAQYTYSNPKTTCDFSIWQYASDGKVAGIDTDVDMNLWIKR